MYALIICDGPNVTKYENVNLFSSTQKAYKYLVVYLQRQHQISWASKIQKYTRVEIEEWLAKDPPKLFKISKWHFSFSVNFVDLPKGHIYAPIPLKELEMRPAISDKKIAKHTNNDKENEKSNNDSERTQAFDSNNHLKNNQESKERNGDQDNEESRKENGDQDNEDSEKEEEIDDEDNEDSEEEEESDDEDSENSEEEEQSGDEDNEKSNENIDEENDLQEDNNNNNNNNQNNKNNKNNKNNNNNNNNNNVQNNSYDKHNNQKCLQKSSEQQENKNNILEPTDQVFTAIFLCHYYKDIPQAVPCGAYKTQKKAIDALIRYLVERNVISVYNEELFEHLPFLKLIANHSHSLNRDTNDVFIEMLQQCIQTLKQLEKVCEYCSSDYMYFVYIFENPVV